MRKVSRVAASSQEAEQAKVMQQVEASATLIDDMIQEVARELFLDAAVTHVMEGQQEGGQAQPASGGPAAAVAAAVGQRLEQMDGTFLATLDGYIQGASDKGAAEVAELLLMIRDEVLRRLSAQLPPEMRLMEAALAAPDAQQRLAMLKQYALLSTDAMPQEAEIVGSSEQDGGGSEGGSLYCLAADLEATVSRVIADMELLPTIPDRRLLARLVVLREEVHQLLGEASYLQGGAAEGSREAEALRLPFRQAEAVPKADAAFVQRLMGLSGSDERRALLEWAFEDDRQRLHDTQGIGAQRGTPLTTFERARKAAEAPQEWVRPGRFMQCVNALQQEMLERAEGGKGGSSGEVGGEGMPSKAVLERLESVRREALQVLLALAEEGLPYRP